jgi:hypothetical protein
MSDRLSPQDQTLLRVVGEVLHYVWDPIGVAGVPQARDEYDGYIGAVCSLLRSGAPESDMAAHLVRVADERMGIPGRDKESREAAALLVDWRDFLAESRA